MQSYALIVIKEPFSFILHTYIHFVYIFYLKGLGAKKGPLFCSHFNQISFDIIRIIGTLKTKTRYYSLNFYEHSLHAQIMHQKHKLHAQIMR